MKKEILLVIISILFICQSKGQILEIPYSGTDVTVTISGSIYYDNGSPQTNDHIYGVSVLYVRNGGDGSISTGNIYEGTDYYKPNPDVLHFTSNIGTHSLYVYALDWENQGTLHGQYNVNVNGVDYTLTPSNVVYHKPCYWTYWLGVDDLSRISNHFKIFPNPSSDKINIETSEEPNHSNLSILNLNGQELLQRIIIEPSAQVDISNLPSGVYFVKLTVDKTVHVRKIIKQ